VLFEYGHGIQQLAPPSVADDFRGQGAIARSLPSSGPVETCPPTPRSRQAANRLWPAFVEHPLTCLHGITDVAFLTGGYLL